MKKGRIFNVVLILLFAGLLLSACGSSDEKQTSGEESGSSKIEGNSHAGSENNGSEDAGDEKTSNAEIFQHEMEMEELIQKAKEEEQITLYTSMDLTDSRPITDAFTEKYGIEVKLWRGNGDDLVHRTLAETNAGHYEVDVVETDSPNLEKLRRENITVMFQSPYFKDLPSNIIPEHKEWVPDRFNFFVMGWNTNIVKPDEVPQTYQDLLKPQWKGNFAVESGDVDWFAAVVKGMGEEKGLAYFEKLVKQEPIIRHGHTLITQLVAAGEVPLCLDLYNHRVQQMIDEKSAPLAWKPLQPAFGRPNGVALSKNAPHPHAALLFADFLLSPDGQNIIKSLGRVPSSTKVDSELNDFEYELLNPAILLDEFDKWNAKFEKLFLTK